MTRKPSLREVVTTMRRFVLDRERDVSGVSGTGIVADGVEFPGGEIVLRWRGETPSIAIYYNGIAAVKRVHGHQGGTHVRWLDEWPGRPCWCCSEPTIGRPRATDPWEGRLDGYCEDCALARCDYQARACGKERQHAV